MKCNEIQKKLPAYQEGEPDQNERMKIEDHLRSCGKCSRELAMLIKTKKHISAMKEVEPPLWLEKSIMEQVRNEDGQKRRSHSAGLPWLPVMARAIPVIFLVLIGFLVYRTMDFNQRDGERYEEKQQVKSAPLKEERLSGKLEKDTVDSGKIKRKELPALPSTPQAVPQEPPKQKPAAAPAPARERAIPSKEREEGFVQGEGKIGQELTDVPGQKKMMLYESSKVSKSAVFHVTLVTQDAAEDIADLLARSGIARSDIEVKPDGTIHARLSRDKIETIISELKKTGDITHSDSVTGILQEIVSVEIIVVKKEK